MKHRVYSIDSISNKGEDFRASINNASLSFSSHWESRLEGPRDIYAGNTAHWPCMGGNMNMRPSSALIRLGWETDLLKSLINRRDAGDKETFQVRGCAAHFPLLRRRTTETANLSQNKKPDGRETVWLLEGDFDITETRDTSNRRRCR